MSLVPRLPSSSATKKVDSYVMAMRSNLTPRVGAPTLKTRDTSDVKTQTIANPTSDISLPKTQNRYKKESELETQFAL